MDRRAFGLSAVASLAVAGCGRSNYVSRFKTYHGPEVTSVVVNKGARKVYLLNGEGILREYKMDLGFAPLGHKQVEGDGKPRGLYRIDRRNPNSAFHLSLGISYPNAADRAYAQSLGKRPGGEIFIHGEPNSEKERKRAARVSDWTAGCIAVRNQEIEEIYAMVRDGTPIALRA